MYHLRRAKRRWIGAFLALSLYSYRWDRLRTTQRLRSTVYNEDCCREIFINDFCLTAFFCRRLFILIKTEAGSLGPPRSQKRRISPSAFRSHRYPGAEAVYCESQKASKPQYLQYRRFARCLMSSRRVITKNCKSLTYAKVFFCGSLS
jgi:hypothetical protein